MIAIPNMGKPKRCIEEVGYGLLDNPCLFVDEREACLLQNNSKIGEYEENYKTCPLIEIVTCGECKHYKREECRLDPFWERYTEPNDFCSQGERRADEHTD